MSNINRFNGHPSFPYSVAQHSVILSHIVPPRLAKAAFAHDWSEAWVGDIITPIKQALPYFQEIEDTIQRVIFSHLEIPFGHMEEIHPYDKALGREEWYQLFEPSYSLTGLNISEISWRQARSMFMSRYWELFDD